MPLQPAVLVGLVPARGRHLGRMAQGPAVGDHHEGGDRLAVLQPGLANVVAVALLAPLVGVVGAIDAHGALIEGSEREGEFASAARANHPVKEWWSRGESNP